MKQMKNNKDGKSKTAKMKSEIAKSLGPYSQHFIFS